MKLPRFEPEIALLFGFVIVPLSGALNWLLLEVGRLGFYPSLRVNFFRMLMSLVIISAPQGWMTTRLVQIWRKGRFASARSLALGCALFSLVFWGWLFGRAADDWRASEIAAVAPEVLWSFGFLLFAIFARPPRR